MGSRGWFSTGRAPAHGTGSREYGGQRCPYRVKSNSTLSLGWVPWGRGDTGPSLQPCTLGGHLPLSPVRMPQSSSLTWLRASLCSCGARDPGGAPRASLRGLWQPFPWEALPPIPTGSVSAAGSSRRTRGRASQESGTARARPLGLGTLCLPGTLDGAEPAGHGRLFRPAEKGTTCTGGS